ncbi:MAG TPA: rhodanese-like domain-containing protein [Desulfitobacterium dehalogenans]|uniref:Rhodanese-like domain-containing protein n=1 Tax=Desulfitobacterium dehalogenans TaxID=36854 RepID=A0A7C7D8F9_9FIRM|nr:rhodanese-like domain-containing protein [Desulfitobacterium dehalogenans]
MKHWIRFRTLLGISLLAFALAGCSHTSPAAVVEPSSSEAPLVEQFESVRQVVEDFLSSDKVVSMTPEELYQIVQERNDHYYLVDIRANQDFINSNIQGSVSIPYAQTSDPEKLEALPKDKTLVVIDYNGHQAAQTAATWNQLGYQAVPLLYGVQSWTQEASSTGYEAFPVQPLNNALITEVNPITLSENTFPEIKYPEGRTQDYIAQTTRTYLDRNYKGVITAEELYGELQQGSTDHYFLVDIRDLKYYQQGHIEGAVNIPLDQLADLDKVKSYSPDKRIVLIGYDGMDASQGARSLVTLGYDCVALKYGMSYWSAEEEATGVAPVHSLVKEYYQLTPLNYLPPSTGAAGCG